MLFPYSEHSHLFEKQLALMVNKTGGLIKMINISAAEEAKKHIEEGEYPDLQKIFEEFAYKRIYLVPCIREGKKVVELLGYGEDKLASMIITLRFEEEGGICVLRSKEDGRYLAEGYYVADVDKEEMKRLNDLIKELLKERIGYQMDNFFYISNRYAGLSSKRS